MEFNWNFRASIPVFLPTSATVKHNDGCKPGAKCAARKMNLASYGRMNWIIHHLWRVLQLPSVQLLGCKKSKGQKSPSPKQAKKKKKKDLCGVKTKQKKKQKNFQVIFYKGNQVTKRSSTEKILNIWVASQHLSNPHWEKSVRLELVDHKLEAAEHENWHEKARGTWLQAKGKKKIIIKENREDWKVTFKKLVS